MPIQFLFPRQPKSPLSSIPPWMMFCVMILVPAILFLQNLHFVSAQTQTTIPTNIHNKNLDFPLPENPQKTEPTILSANPNETLLENFKMNIQVFFDSVMQVPSDIQQFITTMKNSAIEWNITWDDISQSISFSNKTALQPGESIRLNMTENIRSSTNEALKNPQVFDWKTREETPKLLWSSPLSSRHPINRESEFILALSHPIINTGENLSLIQITGNLSGAIQSIQRIDEKGYIYLTPTKLLLGGEEITLTISKAIQFQKLNRLEEDMVLTYQVLPEGEIQESFENMTYKDKIQTTGTWDTRGEAMQKEEKTFEFRDIFPTYFQHIYGIRFGGNVALQQPMTPKQTTWIDQININLKVIQPAKNLMMIVYPANNSFEPTGNPIASKELLEKEIQSASVLSFYFPEKFELKAGQNYVIQLRAPQSPAESLEWVFSQNTNYPKGKKITLPNTQGSAYPYPFVFSTYESVLKNYSESSIIQSIGYNTTHTSVSYQEPKIDFEIEGIGQFKMLYSDSSDGNTFGNWTEDISTLNKQFLRFRIEINTENKQIPLKVKHITIPYAAKASYFDRLSIKNNIPMSPHSLVNQSKIEIEFSQSLDPESLTNNLLVLQNGQKIAMPLFQLESNNTKIVFPNLDTTNLEILEINFFPWLKSLHNQYLHEYKSYIYGPKSINDEKQLSIISLTPESSGRIHTLDREIVIETSHVLKAETIKTGLIITGSKSGQIIPRVIQKEKKIIVQSLLPWREEETITVSLNEMLKSIEDYSLEKTYRHHWQTGSFTQDEALWVKKGQPAIQTPIASSKSNSITLSFWLSILNNAETYFVTTSNSTEKMSLEWNPEKGLIANIILGAEEIRLMPLHKDLIQLGTWSKYDISLRNDNTAALFIDGKIYASAKIPTVRNLDFQNMLIGSNTPTNTVKQDFFIDEIRLEKAEITGNYTPQYHWSPKNPHTQFLMHFADSFEKSSWDHGTSTPINIWDHETFPQKDTLKSKPFLTQINHTIQENKSIISLSPNENINISGKPNEHIRIHNAAGQKIASNVTLKSNNNTLYYKQLGNIFGLNSNPTDICSTWEKNGTLFILTPSNLISIQNNGDVKNINTTRNANFGCVSNWRNNSPIEYKNKVYMVYPYSTGLYLFQIEYDGKITILPNKVGNFLHGSFPTKFRITQGPNGYLVSTEDTSGSMKTIRVYSYSWEHILLGQNTLYGNYAKLYDVRNDGKEYRLLFGGTSIASQILNEKAESIGTFQAEISADSQGCMSLSNGWNCFLGATATMIDLSGKKVQTINTPLRYRTYDSHIADKVIWEDYGRFQVLDWKYSEVFDAAQYISPYSFRSDNMRIISNNHVISINNGNVSWLSLQSTAKQNESTPVELSRNIYTTQNTDQYTWIESNGNEMLKMRVGCVTVCSWYSGEYGIYASTSQDGKIFANEVLLHTTTQAGTFNNSYTKVLSDGHAWVIVSQNYKDIQVHRILQGQILAKQKFTKVENTLTNIAATYNPHTKQYVMFTSYMNANIPFKMNLLSPTLQILPGKTFTETYSFPYGSKILSHNDKHYVLRIKDIQGNDFILQLDFQGNITKSAFRNPATTIDWVNGEWYFGTNRSKDLITYTSAPSCDLIRMWKEYVVCSKLYERMLYFYDKDWNYKSNIYLNQSSAQADNINIWKEKLFISESNSSRLFTLSAANTIELEFNTPLPQGKYIINFNHENIRNFNLEKPLQNKMMEISI